MSDRSQKLHLLWQANYGLQMASYSSVVSAAVMQSTGVLSYEGLSPREQGSWAAGCLQTQNVMDTAYSKGFLCWYLLTFDYPLPFPIVHVW